MSVEFKQKSGKRLQMLSAINKMALRKTKVGMPEEKNKQVSSGIDLASLMTVHEFGSPKMNIPPRPFALQTSKKSDVRKEIGRIMRVGYKKIIKGTPVDDVLSEVGEYYEWQLKQTITEQKFTPLSPEYAARKYEKVGHVKKLIWDGSMRDSITHVETGKFR